VAEMRGLIEWPNYDQPNAFRLNKVINEPDFLSLHVGRILAQAASLVRAQQGKLTARLPLPRRRSQKIRLGQ
jgi:LPS sulfotransferase NodH